MLTGTLIGESIRANAPLTGVPLTVTEIRRDEVPDPAPGQPSTFTVIAFSAPDGAADQLAAALAHSLSARGGWYCDFRTDTESFVVFAGRIFRYPRGDQAGRAAAVEYGRSAGVPEHQLDWGH